MEVTVVFRSLGESPQSMVKMVEMDEVVTLQQQMGQEVSPVILINKFTVHPVDVEVFLQAWAQDAASSSGSPASSPRNCTVASAGVVSS